MRVDKYLKVSRLIKKREYVKQLVEQGWLFVNGRASKASKDISVNDTIEIQFANKAITVIVKDIKNQVSKKDAYLMYEIISERNL